MDIRSVKEASWIARFIHILILAAVVAPGVVSGLHVRVAVLTAVWFVVFAIVYLLVRPGGSTVRNHTPHRQP